MYGPGWRTGCASDPGVDVATVGYCFFFFQAEDGIRDYKVTGVQTCALPISSTSGGGVMLALRRMLAMRLLAAVRLADSGSSRKVLSALRRASKSSGEAGRAASTASNISVVTAAWPGRGDEIGRAHRWTPVTL